MSRIISQAKAYKRLEDLKKATKDAAKELGGREFMEKLGKFAADMVRLRTRLGYGVSGEGAEKQRLKPLADSTKAERAGKIAFRKALDGKGSYTYPLKPDEPPKLSPLTTAAKSNLTRTGQLLDSIKIKKIAQAQVTVGPSGERKPDPRAPGAKVPTNSEVAKFAEQGGRPFNYLSKTEIKRCKDMIAKEMKAILRRRLTKSK